MSRLNTLLAKQGELIDKQDALLAAAANENRALTEAEETTRKDLEAEDARVQESIEVEKRLEARKNALAKPVDPNANAKVAAKARVRYGKIKNFTGPNAEEDAYKSGMWVRAVMFDDAKAAAWCAENGVSIIRNAQSEGVNTAGGFLVPQEFSSAIIDLREEFGTFRQYCKIVPMGSDSISIPRRASGLTAYWTGENAQITESQKGWDQVLLVAKKLAALARMSTELAEDAVINIADDLAAEMAYAFAVAEDSAGWNGDGTSTYGGINGLRTKMVAVLGAGQLNGAMDAAPGHDAFAEIDATDLTNLMARLPKYAERNAKWYASSVGWDVVFQRLVAAAGGTSMGDLTGGKPSRSYLGYPVIIDQTLPTATTDISDTAMLFFGDLSMAVSFGERRGISVMKSDDRYFEFDQIGIKATERIDINVHDIGTATVSGPIVALIAE